MLGGHYKDGWVVAERSSGGFGHVDDVGSMGGPQFSAPAVRQNVLGAAAGAEARNRDFHVVIGSLLTASNKPYLVQTYGGHLFVFALSEEEARHSGVRPSETFFSCHNCERPPIVAAPQVVIEDFTVDDADHKPWSEPLSGRCRYVSEGPLPENHCLRVEMVLQLCAPGANCDTAAYCYQAFAPGAG